jgi:hypothetical protein
LNCLASAADEKEGIPKKVGLEKKKSGGKRNGFFVFVATSMQSFIVL